MKHYPLKEKHTSLKKSSIVEANHEDRSKQDDRITLGLLAEGLSPNQVTRHFENVFRRQRKAHKVRQVLKKNKYRIRSLNQKFDIIACHCLTIMEIDETFKGRRVSLLVVVDTLTGYIFHLQWIPNRTKNSLLKALLPLKSLFLHVQLILTDGAPYFPDLVKVLCPQAKHQLCLVHLLRNIHPLLRPFQTNYTENIRELKEIRKQLDTCGSKLKNFHYKLKKRNLMVKYWEKKRNNLRTVYEVVPYQKNILKCFPKLKQANLRINLAQGYVRSHQKSIQRYKKKQKTLQSKIEIQEKEVNGVWNIYMREIRRLYRFYNLFHLKNKKYLSERENFLKSLEKTSFKENKLAEKLHYYLTEVQHVDTVNRRGCPVRLSRKFINTNVIESINAQIRPYLDQLRNIQNTEYCRLRLDFLRLKLNTHRPFSGRRKDTCPIERCGYNLRGRTLLDLIFDGCPPGPQSYQNLPVLNSKYITHERLKGVSIEG